MAPNNAVESGSEVELVVDGDGIAVFGSNEAVERFLAPSGLASREIDVAKLRSVVGRAGTVIEGVSLVQQNFGRWVKLTEKSAELIAKGKTMKGSTERTFRAIVTGKKGIEHQAEFLKMSAGLALSNPALLAGLGGIMAQNALQQSMDEITDYLHVIDAKVDDIIRAQKDSAIASIVGADLMLQEAFAVREEVGRVSDINWSKIQALPQTLHTAQAYALRRLDAAVEKIDESKNVKELAEVTKRAKVEAHEWMSVIAHCVKLQDGVGVIELDRVFEAHPEELDSHRRGLQISRDRQRESISRVTAKLMGRIEDAAAYSNSRALQSPLSARKVVDSSNTIIKEIVGLNGALGIEQDHEAINVVKWREAVATTGQKVAATTVGGAQVVARTGVAAGKHIADRTQKAASTVAAKARRANDDDPENDETPWLLEQVNLDPDQ